MYLKIKFYSTADEYGDFSNFAAYPISIKRKKWPTVEHYYQAQKFLDITYQEKIRHTKSPIIAVRLGRDRRQKLRNDWETIKVQIMRQALLAKFSQYAHLKQLLLATENAELIEHTDKDSYWGDGGNGSGKNMLGKLLMELRQILSKAQAS